MNAHDNEHIQVHRIEGFISDDVMGAMREVECVSKGIKSRLPLFSVSLSPPANQRVGVEVFDAAIAEIEERNGLSGFPKVVVFHEKESRRHAHAVWSRIDPATMTVQPLPFFKMKLRELAKEIFLEQQWELPRGFVDTRERDPTAFTLAEWQQAKREGNDAKKIKMLAQEAWAISQDRDAFAKALEARGMYLAKGDRRAHVAMTYEGSVFALSRLLGRKAKEVRERFGEADDLRSVEDTRAYVRERIVPMLQKTLEQAQADKAREMETLAAERLSLTTQHRRERERLEEGLRQRFEAETRERSTRLQRGLAGLWQVVSGQAKAIITQNQREAYAALLRDRSQREAIITDQLRERSGLQVRIEQTRAQHFERMVGIHRDLANQYEHGPVKTQEPLAPTFNATSQTRLEWLKTRQRGAQPVQSSADVDRLNRLREQQARRRSPEREAPSPQRGFELEP